MNMQEEKKHRMNQFKNLAAYEVVEEKAIKEIKASGYVLRHKKKRSQAIPLIL